MKLATSLIAFAIAVAPMFAHAAPSKPASSDKVENVGKPAKKVRHKKHAARHIEKPTLVKASATSKPHKRKKIEKALVRYGKRYNYLQQAPRKMRDTDIDVDSLFEDTAAAPNAG